jgi:hypothetical protein
VKEELYEEVQKQAEMPVMPIKLYLTYSDIK